APVAAGEHTHETPRGIDAHAGGREVGDAIGVDVPNRHDHPGPQQIAGAVAPHRVEPRARAAGDDVYGAAGIGVVVEVAEVVTAVAVDVAHRTQPSRRAARGAGEADAVGDGAIVTEDVHEVAGRLA